ncbi:MAG: dTDP-4-dehydrorhamnose reductase [Ferruginibacter sp.]|nr:dTDP-4-dehydrorhamnose reductase [Ferruginibacter sp.]
MEFRSLADQYPRFRFLFVTKEQLPINDTAAIDHYFSSNNIDYCINCAAYTAVDKAETENETAFEINGYAAGSLAAICKKQHTTFIHFSTDYVFNGEAKVPYKETDETDPVNSYGASKLLGEQEALKNNPATIIIRTSWVYSSFGKNFVKTMLRLMNEKESISVVSDQLGCPTYANDLAAAVMEIISKNDKPMPGIYNYCNNGVISWYEFALAIKDISGSACKVNPINTEQYPTPAKRPAYSVLDTTKITVTFHLNIPYWKDSLEKCIALIKQQS